MIRSGHYTAELFMNILLDEGERRIRRCRAANMLSRFQEPVAKFVLFNSLNVFDNTVRAAVLESLIKGRFDIEPKDREMLNKLLATELTDARFLVEALGSFLKNKKFYHLNKAIRQELLFCRKRMLMILVLLNREWDILRPLLYWYVDREDQAVPDDILEKISRLVSGIYTEDNKKELLDFLTCMDPETVREKWGIFVDQTPRNIVLNLKAIAFGSSVWVSSWTRVCALVTIVKLNMKGSVSRIIECLKDSDDIVRETAAWALFKLNPQVFEKYLPRLRNDASMTVSRTARLLDMKHP
jgi:hypothetical protein